MSETDFENQFREEEQAFRELLPTFVDLPEDELNRKLGLMGYRHNEIHLQKDGNGQVWVRKHFKATLNPNLFRAGAYDLAEREVLACQLGTIAGVPIPRTHLLAPESNIAFVEYKGRSLDMMPRVRLTNPQQLLRGLLFAHWLGDDDDRRLDHVVVDNRRKGWHIDFSLAGIGHPKTPTGHIMSGREFGDFNKLRRQAATFIWLAEYLEFLGYSVTNGALVRQAEKIASITDEIVRRVVGQFTLYVVGRREVITDKYADTLIERKHRLVETFQNANLGADRNSPIYP